MMRQKGITTSQIRSAPKDSIYICLNASQVSYIRDLAIMYSRRDLLIKTVQFIVNKKYLSLNKYITFDHGVYASKHYLDLIKEHNEKIRYRNNSFDSIEDVLPKELFVI